MTQHQSDKGHSSEVPSEQGNREPFYFEVPDEGHAILVGEHYLSLGRDSKNRLLAIITKGHPNVHDGNTEVCSINVVADRLEAAHWFAEELIGKPWLPRS